MSCCGGNCNCGSSCTCASCGKMYADMEMDPILTLIHNPPKRFTNNKSVEESFGTEGSANDGCKCGSNCDCGDNCSC
ncbi:OLC1v1029005C1 [Oldenlandia corymbosa var. corymbosa]|uniref:Metallothionein-like protein n=1 Tax=Oldenlandia corymbosa var. corymbosa TaxID=529605 RepID=A0AAV1CD98_OLDCO|nr:OLC1v1029005C1 [Oldenlandia corymbosa var. corymbosa]